LPSTTLLRSPRTIDAKMIELTGQVEKLRGTIQNEVLPASQVAEIEAQVDRMLRHKTNIYKLMEPPYDSLLNFADDDILVRGEFMIPIGREVKFVFRSH